MPKKSKLAISSGANSFNLLAGENINLSINEIAPIAIELIDSKVQENVEKLRKSRFFSEFDKTRSSLRLGTRLFEGDLSSASNNVKERGLAWCTRLLSPSDELEQAEKFLKAAKLLGSSPETTIAEAFIFSQKGNKAEALQLLGGINSDASRSASLMIVAHHDDAESALKWMNDAGYTAEDLDSDGKAFLLMHQLQLGYWDAATRTVGTFSETDVEETPILHHLVALTRLIAAIPADFRAVVLTQVPFSAREFPLGSDADSMDARQAAHEHFLRAVKAAKQLDCDVAARMDDEYALWLELRDPAQNTHGKKRLENKLRAPNTGLGLVHYALMFGIKLDLDKVEKDIERNVTLNGGMTRDASIARFALAFTKPTPEDTANYIVRYRNQLSPHIDPKKIQFHLIEMFSRAGLTKKANEVLHQLVKQGISPEEERSLRCIVEEAEGKDPVESRKAQYKTTHSLGDLIDLVDELEIHQHWDDLCKYGRRLFEETCSLSDAERLVVALSNTYKSKELVEFLNENHDLLSQSKNLQMAYSWGLYHEGALLESRAALEKLSDDAGSPNYRALQVNVEIAMGDWDSLHAYVASEFQNRAHRSAQDLIRAAQLALILRSPHARHLVFEAGAKAGDDAEMLSAAYFLATNAGWESDPQVFKWLKKATELSGDDGPLQRMSLKDILEKKSEWDREESETWRSLAKSQIDVV